MKDNNKKPREYRDALSDVYIPEWSELTEDERQEACKEIYVNALNHIYMASAFNEIVKFAIKLDFNDEIIIDSLFKYLYRFVAEDKIRAKDTDRFLEEHPEFKGVYGARYKIGKEFGQAYMDKVKPEFLFKEIKIANEKQPYTSSAFSDEIKAKIDKIKNMSDKELLEVLKDDDKMKELTDIKGDFVIPSKDDIDTKDISQLIINYMQKSHDRVKFCLNQLAEKDKKIHSLNLRIRELESDLRIINHSEEANNTSSSN